MAQTKLTNLINPQVMADMISAQLPSKIKFSPLARIDTTLEGQPGNTITVPKYAYIGDAEDVAEGVAMETTILTATSTQVTVKKAGKSIEITDESALSGYGDPIGQANEQLLTSLAAKVDNDAAEALSDASLTHTADSAISYESVVDAIDKFGEEDDEEKILFIHPLQKGTLRKDPLFLSSVPNAYMTGVIGEIAGCQVVASNKVPAVDGTPGTYENFIVKPGALDIYLKREAQVEQDRDVLAKTTVLAADEHYAVALADDSKVVKLIVNKA
ncbi:N4-gp56 family major capsid protein [Terribacillus saccharophilus]|uniref:N4-gp56 family major capsid protein n=1 Tax=Terribacillus saccharophilus TaxID=361277 RepID=A0ABX4H088_9BACI|nr:N4-gp56 family major capsid protein [Terribacillus saccharophilus]PAD35974.1 N4-gp56 family major capsid protein [Terribacillus saccharophilus]PAD96976.1 N4-gp56 family major capsid protein [Terribacillus saccharophilus]PAE00552.1 N4-gp56 family major capsid protein [Terribacillus saccharophilus]